MTVRVQIAMLLALVAVLLGAGCGGSADAAFAPETEDPTYRQGKQLQRQGRDSEALAAFLKVIETRGARAAPESHFDAGEIYLQHVKDPIAAIFHFRKYLELQPNSQQASRVRDRIGTAMREFARTLPARPFEDQSVRLEAATEIDRLRRENEELRAELATLRGGGATPVYRVARPVPAAEEPRPQPSPPPVESPLVVAPRAAPQEPKAGQAAPLATPTRPTAAPAKSAPPPHAGRLHRVAPQESLWAIARRYYGTPNAGNVQAIRDANPGVNLDALQPGMVLRIP